MRNIPPPPGGVANTLVPSSWSAAESSRLFFPSFGPIPLISDWLSRVEGGSLTDWLHGAFRCQKTFTEPKSSICIDSKTKESKNYW